MPRYALALALVAPLLAACQFNVPVNPALVDWGTSSVTLRDAATSRALDERCRLSSLGPARDYFLTLSSGGATAVQLSVSGGCVNPIPVKLREVPVTVSSVIVAWDSCAAVTSDARADLEPLVAGMTKLVDVELREKGSEPCSESY